MSGPGYAIDTRRPRARLRRAAALAALVALALSLTTAVARPAAAGDSPPPYADTPWPTIHADSRNSDSVDFPIETRYQRRWTALDGAATLVGPNIGPEGNRYVTTGKERGFSNLFAFDADGNSLWSTPPWQDPDDFDSGAIAGGVIVDDDGDLYVSDGNQFWAFHSDGSVKWVVPLPPPPADVPVNSFVTAFFTLDGSVGGITLNGDVVILDRADGSLEAPIVDLPGGPGPASQPPPPGLWAGLVDRDAIPLLFDAFFGRVVEVANTPAVNPVDGRILATATGSVVGQGALYGIDFAPGPGITPADGSIDVVTASPMGPGSGTSPAISPDGTQVYAGDDAGTMFAFDAQTGAELWRFDAGAQAGSPTVDHDGTVVVGAGRHLLALNPDGTVKWRRNYDAIARSWLPNLFYFGAPAATVDGIPAAAENVLLVPVDVGYRTTLNGRRVLVSQYQTVLAIAKDTGDLVEVAYVQRDTNEGFVIPAEDGTIQLSTGAIFSSIASANVNALLPAGFKVNRPVGGIEVAEVRPDEPDTVSVRVTGGVSYEATGAVTSGDFSVEPPGAKPVRRVSGSGTVGGAASQPTVSINAHHNWFGLFGFYSGTVTVADPDTGLHLSAPIIFARSLDGSAEFQASGTVTWFTMSGFSIRPYTLTWSVTDNG